MLTLVLSLSGAAVAAMFSLLLRRSVDWAVVLVATIAMALSPPFRLQSGLALTDMFAILFVVAFLLVEGYPARTPQGDRLRRIACGVIAGLSLGARPHVTLLIVAYWCVRGLWGSRSFNWTHLLTAAVLRCLAAAGGARHRRLQHLCLGLPRTIPIPPRQARGVGARRTRQPVLSLRARGRADWLAGADLRPPLYPQQPASGARVVRARALCLLCLAKPGEAGGKALSHRPRDSIC
jgi:hypothetical protein